MDVRGYMYTCIDRYIYVHLFVRMCDAYILELMESYDTEL